MPLDRFFRKNEKYNGFQYQCTEMFEKMYDWLSQPIHIWKMTEACYQGKPALEGVIEDFVREFREQQIIPLTERYNRQVIGAVVKEIIWDYGYRQTKNYRFSSHIKGDPFKSATHYRYYEELATKKLEVKIEVIKIKDPISMDVSVENIRNITKELA